MFTAMVVLGVLAAGLWLGTGDESRGIASSALLLAASALWHRFTGSSNGLSLNRLFDRPFSRDPLFRRGLALSLVAVWSTLIKVSALGMAHDPYAVVAGFLLAPFAVTILIFGVIGGSVRGLWRGWSGAAE